MGVEMLLVVISMVSVVSADQIGGEKKPLLPHNKSQCFENTYWDFIDTEYQLAEYFGDNSYECLKYIKDPKEYMEKFNDRRPYVPFDIWNCQERNLLRRMDTMKLVGRTSQNLIEKRRYCEQYFDDPPDTHEKPNIPIGPSHISIALGIAIVLVVIFAAAICCSIRKSRQANSRGNWNEMVAGVVPPNDQSDGEEGGRHSDSMEDLNWALEQSARDGMNQTSVESTRLDMVNARMNDLGLNSGLYGPTAPPPSQPDRNLATQSSVPSYETTEEAPPPSYDEAVSRH